MRNISMGPGEYYHVYNRGNNKQEIFLDDRDRIRFLFCILHFQSPITFTNLSRPVTNFVRHRVFNIEPKIVEEIHRQRIIQLNCFCLMPNHFHLLIYQKNEAGVAKYLQRVLDGYTKYFNTKYKRNGHLFQGPYRAVHIVDNDQLLYTSAYLHRNPAEIKKWRDRENQYPWSSYRDYIDTNQWGVLLDQKIMKEQFADGQDYDRWVKSSGAKDPDHLDSLV
ncbi:MAG: transposase [Candidatus Vogelbacteria bacterium]|nr:transposase [Candidatus Vogelbacteria bacterium]